MRASSSSSPGADTPEKLTGVVDFAHREGELRQQPGVMTMRWVGDVTYQQPPSPSAGKAWNRVDYARVAAAAHCREGLISPTSMLGGGGGGAGTGDPSGLLDELRAAGASLDRVGTEVVRGATTTHWNVKGDITSQFAQCFNAFNEYATSVRTTYELWTDDAKRLRRVRTTVNMTVDLAGALPTGYKVDEPKEDHVGLNLTTELFDFGTAVHVEAPPADDVADMTDAYVALVVGPGRVPASAWHRAASGTVREEPWAVWFAETSTHWHCYDVVLPEGVRGGIEVATKDPVRHDGRAAWCPSPGPGPATFTLALAEVDGRDYQLVGITNSGARPVVTFADGTSTPMTFDATTGVAQWRGPASPKPVQVRYGKESCALDRNTENAQLC